MNSHFSSFRFICNKKNSVKAYILYNQGWQNSGRAGADHTLIEIILDFSIFFQLIFNVSFGDDNPQFNSATSRHQSLEYTYKNTNDLRCMCRDTLSITLCLRLSNLPSLKKYYTTVKKINI